jgi:hypothetical protein
MHVATVFVVYVDMRIEGKKTKPETKNYIAKDAYIYIQSFHNLHTLLSVLVFLLQLVFLSLCRSSSYLRILQVIPLLILLHIFVLLNLCACAYSCGLLPINKL